MGKDPRVVELILRESTAVSRQAPGRARRAPPPRLRRRQRGDRREQRGARRTRPPASGPWALLLPEAPDASAAAIRAHVEAASEGRASASSSRTRSAGPFRLGTVGVAIGVAGLPPLWDRRGEADLFGRALEQTITALADQVAAVADLVAGQAAEGRPLVLVRGLRFDAAERGRGALLRKPEEDLYA